MVSYGLAYGMEAYGLGQRLNIPTEEAAKILDAYFEAFPNVKKYMDDTVVEARKRGLHRDPVRPPPADPGAAQRQLADPPGGGAPGDERRHPGPRRRHLQGRPGARRRRRWRSAASASRLVLQVHDEVLVEVPEEEREVVGPLVVDLMRHAADLDVPLEVNVAWGHDLGGREEADQLGRARTGSSRSPITSGRRTCATRSPRGRCRRSITSSRRSGSLRVRGCSTSGAGRGATPTSWPGGGSSSTGSTSPRTFVELASADAPPGVTFERLDARRLAFDAEFDAVICLCQGAFGLMTAGGEDELVVAGMASALRPGGRLALSAFNAYFAVRYHEAATFDAATGVSHERPRCARRPATWLRSTCGPVATRLASSGSCHRARPGRRLGLERRSRRLCR